MRKADGRAESRRRTKFGAAVGSERRGCCWRGASPARSAAVLIRPTGGPRSGGVGYQHECSRRLPLLRCPPLMMIIIGGGITFRRSGRKAHTTTGGLWRRPAAGKGFSKGETERGEPGRRSRRMGRRGCWPHRRGAGGLRERGARPAPPGRRRLRRADCGKWDGRRPERGERVAVITCGTGGASGRGGSAPGARAAWCRRWAAGL